MLNPIKIRLHHGHQTIPDVRNAQLDEKFRGFPVINEALSQGKSEEIARVCPTEAILTQPLRIDMGKCIFCGDCERHGPSGTIKFTNFYKLASTSREHLIVDGKITAEDYHERAIKTRKEIVKLFGRSLKLRSVSAGGCNACEMELSACSNVNFDMGRFGIEIVASPRHADGLVITGPISENMAQPLQDAYTSVPNPKIIILAGTCAVSSGIFATSSALNRDFVREFPIDLYVPGCPFHPLTFINGVLDFLGRK